MLGSLLGTGGEEEILAVVSVKPSSEVTQITSQQERVETCISWFLDFWDVLRVIEPRLQTKFRSNPDGSLPVCCVVQGSLGGDMSEPVLSCVLQQPGKSGWYVQTKATTGWKVSQIPAVFPLGCLHGGGERAAAS